jgi:two-component system response regulator GlrR
MARRGSPEAWQQHIISRSPRMAEALAEARLIAQSDASVLIRGESGTGRKCWRKRFTRAAPAPKAVHCRQLRAIPALLESELFGHVRAPSPTQSACGLFQADGGTCC